MIGSQYLFVGTDSGEYIIGFGDGADEAYSKNNYYSKNIGNSKCSSVTPVSINGAVVYASQDRRLLLLKLSGEFNAIGLTDINPFIVDHYSGVPYAFMQGVRQISVDREHNAVRVLLNSYSLIHITIDESSGVMGWGKNVFSMEEPIYSITNLGRMLAGLGNVYYLPSDASLDSLLPLSKDATQRYLYFDNAFIEYGIVSSIDMSDSYSAGDTVYVVVDDEYLGAMVLDSSAVLNLDTASTSFVQAGLLYTSEIETMPINVAQNNGPSAGKHVRVTKVTPIYYNTGEYEVGFNNGSEEGSYVAGELASGLNTGEKGVDAPADWGNITTFKLRVSEPHPVNIAGVVFEGVVNE
jgi:hypothetical protein